MPRPVDSAIAEVRDFLRLDTPLPWLETAVQHLPTLLVDHAHCERKAAATALNFMSKYPEKRDLIDAMSPLAREELLHFEKVIHLLRDRNIAFGPLTPSGYATHLHQRVAVGDYDNRLRDQLIVGAVIEARSCERFYAIIPWLEDEELARFYQSLVKSEARHFIDYLRLAHQYGKNCQARIVEFLALENAFIRSPEPIFRFHSGIPTLLT